MCSHIGSKNVEMWQNKFQKDVNNIFKTSFTPYPHTWCGKQILHTAVKKKNTCLMIVYVLNFQKSVQEVTTSPPQTLKTQIDIQIAMMLLKIIFFFLSRIHKRDNNISAAGASHKQTIKNSLCRESHVVWNKHKRGNNVSATGVFYQPKIQPIILGVCKVVFQ